MVQGIETKPDRSRSVIGIKINAGNGILYSVSKTSVVPKDTWT